MPSHATFRHPACLSAYHSPCLEQNALLWQIPPFYPSRSNSRAFSIRDRGHVSLPCSFTVSLMFCPSSWLWTRSQPGDLLLANGMRQKWWWPVWRLGLKRPIACSPLPSPWEQAQTSLLEDERHMEQSRHLVTAVTKTNLALIGQWLVIPQACTWTQQSCLHNSQLTRMLLRLCDYLSHNIVAATDNWYISSYKAFFDFLWHNGPV